MISVKTGFMINADSGAFELLADVCDIMRVYIKPLCAQCVGYRFAPPTRMFFNIVQNGIDYFFRIICHERYSDENF